MFTNKEVWLPFFSWEIFQDTNWEDLHSRRKIMRVSEPEFLDEFFLFYFTII